MLFWTEKTWLVQKLCVASHSWLLVLLLNAVTHIAYKWVYCFQAINWGLEVFTLVLSVNWPSRWRTDPPGDWPPKAAWFGSNSVSLPWQSTARVSLYQFQWPELAPLLTKWAPVRPEAYGKPGPATPNNIQSCYNFSWEIDGWTYLAQNMALQKQRRIFSFSK